MSLLEHEPIHAGLADATAAGRRRRWARSLPDASRLRFQLVGGVVCACVLPLALRYAVSGDFGQFISTRNSIVGSFAALLVGVLIFRKLTVFPGVRPTGYVLPVFLGAFGLVAAMFLVLRIYYDRLEFLSGMLLTIIFFHVVSAVRSSVRRPIMQVAPGGDTLFLREIRTVRWRELQTPDDVRVDLPLVADLRGDLSDAWERRLTQAALDGAQVFSSKQVYESLTGRVRVDHVSENSFGVFGPSLIYGAAKRQVDFATALLASVLLAPLMLVLAILVRADSPGPALYRQTRIGYLGREFTMYKFRTMRDRVSQSPGESTVDDQTTRINDPRITRVGAFLRRSRLDELPQILNILCGDMSWIGPRPEADALSKQYVALIPFYAYRHLVRPGITGWAQVNQGHVTSVEQVLQKLQHDFFYVKYFSLWLDLLVTLKTFKVMITGSGAR